MMETERRSLLAFVLIFAFLYVWFEYATPRGEPGTTAVPVVASPSPTEPPLPMPTAAAAPMTQAERFTLESPALRSVWTSRSGVLEEAVLSKYHVTPSNTSPGVQVVPFDGKAPPPLLWTIQLDGTVVNDAELVYRGKRLSNSSVSFEAEPKPGIIFRKTYEGSADGYVWDLQFDVLNETAQPIKVEARTALSTGLPEPKGHSAWSSFLGSRPEIVRLVSYVNEKAYHLDSAGAQKMLEKKAADAAAFEGDISWAGFDSHYFLLAAVATQGRWGALDVAASPTDMGLTFRYPTYEVAAQKSQALKVRLYAGPKDIDILRAAAPTLDRAIDLGDWLGLLARPILLGLRAIHRVVPNYGIAIILLTILVRLLMFPLAQRQAKSMQKMQQHRPELEAIKQKYAKDKEAQARETMGYMRKHGINPMGGCLLLLPQLPILFALYRVLYNSIELRHAPLAFWLRDLAGHDPYFVLPVVLGVAMFVQQKMTPMPAADPAQQTMMKVMPVMFTAFMLFLPAGLNLYILISTLWGIAQQAWVQKMAMQTVAQKSEGKNHARMG